MHLLIFLDPDDKIRTAADTDGVSCAQIPDPDLFPLLYHTVTKTMTHGPCGPGYPNAKCMKDGKCSKHYPKDFSESTTFGDNGYPDLG